MARRRTLWPEAERALLYSRTCQTGLRAVARLAAHEKSQRLVPQAELAREVGVSAASLAQVLHRLRRAGILRARRGPSGGVALARPAREILVSEVVKVFDGAGVSVGCILGFPACGDATPCPAHPVWKRAKALLAQRLEHRTLADLARAIERKLARVAAG